MCQLEMVEALNQMLPFGGVLDQKICIGVGRRIHIKCNFDFVKTGRAGGEPGALRADGGVGGPAIAAIRRRAEAAKCARHSGPRDRWNRRPAIERPGY